MKSGIFSFLIKRAFVASFLMVFSLANAQDSDFWSRVRFGGALGLGFGSGYTNIAVAPQAIYQFNNYVALGAGVQFSYVDQKNWYSSMMYGPNAIALFNPIPEVQLSAEVEQLRVNLDVDNDPYGTEKAYSRDFWNTGLFLGAGYSMNNVTIGIRYNVLFNDNDMVYSEAWMPFIRAYF
ncbi:hypothetical protein [Flavobacterium sp. NRK1]|uniref:hypothetical protein n=1 Tax=Flavobacterium sp. NRK1 TaxID=2954929 RepID=UPI0020928EA3|nr:hypothetical protein [Flavobacterium sp. NRK1]MCO6147877.1 hypothetical protein [Flavobacterium sp. NRK1]